MDDTLRRSLSDAIVAEKQDPILIVIFLLTIQLLTLFLIGASFYLSTAQTRDAAVDARKGVACLIEQMSEHRFATQAANGMSATEHGYELTPTDNRAPTADEIIDTRRRLIVNCNDFLP